MSKKHYLVLKVTILDPDYSFSFVIFLDLYLILDIY